MTEGHRQTRLVTTEEGEFDEQEARERAFPVETDGPPGELADHQEYVPGRGVYDERNNVNELTGREWKVATKSVIHETYPPALGHEARSEHGGQKPPRLCRDLIERFTKADDRVLDPFAGVGGTLLGASLAEHEGTGLREAVGIERVGRWLTLYESVLAAENDRRRDRGEPELARQETHHGDARQVVSELATDSVDCLVTDVPYWDMDEREQTRNEARTRESSLSAFDGSDDQATLAGVAASERGVTDDERTDEDADDAETDDERETGSEPVGEPIGGATKAAWLDGLAEVFDACRRVVREGGYVVVGVGDMYRGGRYEPLAGELATRLRKVGYTMIADLIWYDPSKELHVYGYPHAFVPSMVHQHFLVFRNE